MDAEKYRKKKPPEKNTPPLPPVQPTPPTPPKPDDPKPVNPIPDPGAPERITPDDEPEKMNPKI